MAVDTKRPVRMTDRREIPIPGNPSAERSLLGCILINPEAISTAAAIVREDDFYVEANRTIYETAHGLHDAGIPTDLEMMADALMRSGDLEEIGGLAYLLELPNLVPNSDNAAHYARVIARTGDRRRLLSAWQKHAALGLDSEADPLEAITAAQADLAQIGDRIIHRQGDGLPRGMSAAQLVGLQLPEPLWTAQGILSQGATLLAGPPKLGKSWMCLNLGLSVALGSEALGYTSTTQGSVLYLALEDTWQRLQDRLIQNLSGAAAPEALEIFREWPTLDQGCAEAIERWAQTKPDARLVIVDTLAKVRGMARADEGKGTIYQADYMDVTRLKRVADRRGLTVLIVHHLRKMAAEDPFEEISGTQGILGAADDALILKSTAASPEGGKQYTLFGRGRNIEECALAMRFDGELGVWNVIGQQAEVTYSEARGEVIRAIRENGGPMSAKDIGLEIDRSPDATRQLLSRMVRGGQLVKVARGNLVKYAIVQAEV